MAGHFITGFVFRYFRCCVCFFMWTFQLCNKDGCTPQWSSLWLKAAKFPPVMYPSFLFSRSPSATVFTPIGPATVISETYSYRWKKLPWMLSFTGLYCMWRALLHTLKTLEVFREWSSSEVLHMTSIFRNVIYKKRNVGERFSIASNSMT